MCCEQYMKSPISSQLSSFLKTVALTAMGWTEIRARKSPSCVAYDGKALCNRLKGFVSHLFSMLEVYMMHNQQESRDVNE
jgi:hypothetical protein